MFQALIGWTRETVNGIHSTYANSLTNGGILAGTSASDSVKWEKVEGKKRLVVMEASGQFVKFFGWFGYGLCGMCAAT